MNALKCLLAAAMVWGASGTAHADIVYSAELQLANYPAFRTGNPIFDGPHSLPGQWQSDVQPTVGVFRSRDLIGYTTDPATGAEVPTWGPNILGHHDWGNLGPAAMGWDTSARNGPILDDQQTTGRGTADRNHFEATIHRRDNPAEAQASGTWRRDFSLDPHASFTFAANASLGIAGDASALDAEVVADATTFTGGLSLMLRDAAGRVSAGIGAVLFDSWGSITYGTSPDGFLSLTITNNGDTALLGQLNAGAFAQMSALAAPVPEPEAWLMLLAGAMAVGGTARRRAPPVEAVGCPA